MQSKKHAFDTCLLTCVYLLYFQSNCTGNNLSLMTNVGGCGNLRQVETCDLQQLWIADEIECKNVSLSSMYMLLIVLKCFCLINK